MNPNLQKIVLVCLILTTTSSIFTIFHNLNPKYIIVKTIDTIEVVNNHKVDTMYSINKKYNSYDYCNCNVGDTLWIKK